MEHSEVTAKQVESMLVWLKKCDAMITDPSGKRLFRISDHWYANDLKPETYFKLLENDDV